MKKLFGICFALLLHGNLFCAAQTQKEKTFFQQCRLKVAETLLSLVPTIIEMATLELAKEGNIEAVDALIEIQHSKSPLQLFCEANSYALTDVFIKMIESVRTANPVKIAIGNAIFAAMYRITLFGVKKKSGF